MRACAGAHYERGRARGLVRARSTCAGVVCKGVIYTVFAAKRAYSALRGGRVTSALRSRYARVTVALRLRYNVTLIAIKSAAPVFGASCRPIIVFIMYCISCILFHLCAGASRAPWLALPACRARENPGRGSV
nr:MAG TPA: hypothetical protein [Bacteriophage sp.]